MKILNLFAGIGGNRKYWKGDITAIEINERFADIYKIFFPYDIVIIDDAYDFVLKNYQHFEFIWASPPCQTHSHTNHFLHAQGIKRFPDMRLWQLIIFLKTFVKCGWIVENVKPYYQPLIKESFIHGRHYYWSNFPGPHTGYKASKFDTLGCKKDTYNPTLEELEDYYGIQFDNGYLTKTEKLQALSNCVLPKEGLKIFQAYKKQSSLEKFGIS